MTARERHDRIAELFHLVADLSPPERAAVLHRECAGDEALRDEVLRLLEAGTTESAGAGRAIGVTAAAIVESARETAGSRIGPYKLLEQIGEGGFGVVYLAEQDTPVVRRVALKVIKLGMDTRQVVARFEAERQALALMDHPNIAKVLDAGATENGRPYFVMELVRGDPITEYCDTNNLSTGARLDLFKQVCHAVQHAHQKGIIHRDLKPGNILVTMFDGRPVPKVIDFGIAKALSQRLTDKTLFTAHRQLIGTPQYMSPEQAEMSGVDIDTRSDIYSLGVLLYELLTGTTPFDPEHLRSAALAEVARIIREEEPPKPSTRLSSLGALSRVAGHRRSEPARLSALVRGDLDWIVMKCLEKDRTRRYGTADGLAADIHRHTRGEPVNAAPPSRVYRVRKFVRRNRGAVGVAGMVGLTLVVGMAGTGTFAWRERAARAEAERRGRETWEVARFQADMLTGIDPASAGEQLFADLRERLALSLGRAGSSAKQCEAISAAFDDGLSRLNATDAAAAMIERSLLRPAVSTIDERFGGQALVGASLRQSLERVYHQLGLYQAALPLQEAALGTRRELLGPDHADTLESLHYMGSLLRSLGRLPEAEAALKEAAEGRERALGAGNPAALASLVERAGVLWQSGAPGAEAEVAALLERVRVALGPASEEAIWCMTSLALILIDAEKFSEAEAMLRDALERARRTPGPASPLTRSVVGNLGVALQRSGRAAEAEPFLREAADRSRAALGEDHETSILHTNNLLIALKDQGRYAEAESLRREVLERRLRILGPLHPATLDCQGRLGLLLLEAGRHEEAEGFLREALSGQRRVLGDTDQSTIQTLGNLADSLSRQRKFDEAEPLCLEVLERSRAALGDEHPTTITRINNLGGMYFEQRRFAEAERCSRESLALARKVFGEDAPNTLTSIWNVGFQLQVTGRHAEAEPYYRELVEKQTRLRDAGDPDRLSALSALGSLLIDLGRLDEAEPPVREALEGRRRVLGDDHTDTITSELDLARLLLANGDADAARSRAQDAFNAARDKLGEDDLFTLRAMGAFGRILVLSGHAPEAEPLLRSATEGLEHKGGPTRWSTVNARCHWGMALAALSRFPGAEQQLLRADADLPACILVPPGEAERLRQAIVRMYQAWDAAEPGNGHGAAAAEWQARLDQSPSSPPAAAEAR